MKRRHETRHEGKRINETRGDKTNETRKGDKKEIPDEKK